MDKLSYKGFFGSIEEAEVNGEKYYYGEVLDVCGVCLYEGRNMEELQMYFQKCVDDMIELSDRLKFNVYTGEKLESAPNKILITADGTTITNEQIFEAFYKNRDKLDIGIYDEDGHLIGLKDDED